MIKPLFNLSNILVVVAIGGMVAIHYLKETLGNGWYLKSDNVGFLFTLFFLMFIIFYVTMAAIAFLKYSMKKKFCTAMNCKTMCISILLLYPLNW